MKITSNLTDPVLLSELGARLAAARIERNLTQADLAEKSGVSKRSVERIESGEVAAQLSVFIRILRGLGMLENLEVLLPESKPGPMNLLKSQGKRRQRATSNKFTLREQQPWSWGEK